MSKRTKSQDALLHQSQGEPSEVILPTTTDSIDPEIKKELDAILEEANSTAPIIRTYGFIRVKDGQTGGFTTVITTIQGDKVIKTEILDKIWNKLPAEDEFRVLIAREMFHLAPEKTYEITFKDGAYTWKL